MEFRQELLNSLQTQCQRQFVGQVGRRPGCVRKVQKVYHGEHELLGFVKAPGIETSPFPIFKDLS